MNAPSSYHCPCGWSRIVTTTLEEARIAHEGTDIHRLNTSDDFVFVDDRGLDPAEALRLLDALDSIPGRSRAEGVRS